MKLIPLGYESNSLDGNNSSLLLKAVPKLRTAKLDCPEAAEDGELLAPPTAGPILDTLSALLKLVQGTMSHTLDPLYKEYIARWLAIHFYKFSLTKTHPSE